MIVVPYKQLSAEALQALLEEFITRDGTDYGMVELSLSEKVDRAYQMLARNEVVIVFDEVTETTHIMRAGDMP